MADVEWSQTAVDQITEIVAYIARSNPAAAEDMNVRLFRLGNSLEYAPNRGRPVAGGVRELVTARPFILRYRVIGEHVRILSVRHSARDTDRP